MKTLKYYIFFIVLIALSSCEKEYMVYESNSFIQFGPEYSKIYNKSYNLLDTVKPYTFFYSPPSVRQDTVFFDIYAIGSTSSIDRAFKLEQVQLPETNNAVAGKHYQSFDDPSVSGKYVIKAGQLHTRIPIVILRDESLKQNEYTLHFKVVSNGYFNAGEPELTWRKVLLSDQINRPARWDSWMERYRFGKYSFVKHKFLIDQTGEKWDQDFFLNMYANFALGVYWNGKAKSLLIAYNAAHPNDPLKDENGELVLFP